MARRRLNRRKASRGMQLQELRARAVAWLGHWGPKTGLALAGLLVPYLVYAGYSHVVSGPTFELKRVDIEGASRVGEEEVRQAAGLVDGVNVLDLDLARVEEGVLGLSWVKEVLAEREFPDVLKLRVVEHEPAMLLVDEGYVLVSEEGGFIKELEATDGVDELMKLPVLTGITRQELVSRQGRLLFEEAVAALAAFEAQGISGKVELSEVHVDPVLGVSLVTMGAGTEIRLGMGRMPERLARVEAVLDALSAQDEEADYILVDHEDDLGRIPVGRRSWAGMEAGSGRP